MAINLGVLAGRVDFNKILGDGARLGGAGFRGESQHSPIINRDAFELWGNAQDFNKNSGAGLGDKLAVSPTSLLGWQRLGALPRGIEAGSCSVPPRWSCRVLKQGGPMRQLGMIVFQDFPSQGTSCTVSPGLP